MKNRPLAPALLTQRHDAPKQNTWHGAPVAPIVTQVSANYGQGTYHVPNTPGGDPLTRYALISARYGTADLEAVAARWNTDPDALDTANIAINALTYRMAFSGEPLPTIPGPQLARIVPDDLQASARALVGIIGTSAERGYIRERAERYPHERAYLNRVRALVREIENHHSVRYLCDTEPDDDGDTNADMIRVNLAERMGHAARRARDKRERDTAERIAAEQLENLAEYGTLVPQAAIGKFAALCLAYPDLELSHHGRLGRSVRPADRGRSLRYAANYYGDPSRRIYGRTARGTNAVVLVDASGSMALTTDELEQIMSASAGALVIAYSHSSHTVGQANAWRVASKGRRVRTMPDGLGRGNGVDGPALIYAISQRRAGAPVVWITDGQVTSAGDGYYPEGAKACKKLAQQHRVIVVPDVENAVSTLRQIRSGRRVKPTLGPLAYA